MSRRARFVFVIGALAAAGCASLGVVEKSPSRQTVTAILVKALACVDKPGEDPCDPALQPAEIRLSALDCESLPLRSGFREAAHARCVFAGEMLRVNGERVALAARAGDFSLIDLTPGSYRPTREWSLRTLEQ